jgi:hypothetical protein
MYVYVVYVVVLSTRDAFVILKTKKSKKNNNRDSNVVPHMLIFAEQTGIR